SSRKRHTLVARLSCIYKRDSAEIAEKPLPQLDRSRIDRGSADRIAVGKQRSDGLVAVPANGRASAGIKPLVRWKIESRGGAHDRAHQPAKRKHSAAASGKVEITRGRCLPNAECQRAGPESLGWCEDE